MAVMVGITCQSGARMKRIVSVGSANLYWVHFYQHGLTLIPAWISDAIYYVCDEVPYVWDEITDLFLNFNGCTVEILEWISNFIPHFTGL